MAHQPLISVVIPVYNREKYIKNCLDIITNQSYQNLEIIVVDDGSSDSSVDIIKQYPQVHLIQHSKNKGLATARNTGMDNATGKYIHFMDDDDEVNSTFYENLLKASEETDADMSCCSMVYQNIMSKSILFSERNVYTSMRDKYEITYVAKSGYVWRYLFKLEFLKNHNLRFEDGRLIEDLPFTFQAVYYANKVVTVPDAKYLYVFNPNSIINTKDKERAEKRENDSDYAEQFIRDFAKEHHFKIPGVHIGRTKYFFTKVQTGIKLAFKYRNLKALKF